MVSGCGQANLYDILLMIGTAGSLDPFDSYFRARLVCVLLDTCGMYFDHGSSRKKLDAFLTVFQVKYIIKCLSLSTTYKY